MPAADSTFDEKLEFARHTERGVSEWLQSRGWYVLPTYDYSGLAENKAPKMHGRDDSLVIPDLDICKGGERRWAEVKYKDQSTYHRKTGTVEHGISARLLSHYRAVQSSSGCDVWVLVIEAANETAPHHVEESRVLLGAPLSELGDPRVYGGYKMGRSGMAFWPRERFRVFGEWDEIGLTIKDEPA